MTNFKNKLKARTTVTAAFTKAFIGGTLQIIDRVKHRGKRAATGQYHQNIKECADVPGVFYRHTHEAIGEPSEQSVSFYFRRPSKDATDPFGHTWVTFNDGTDNEKLSYVANSFAGKMNPIRAIKVLFGHDDEVTPGKLVERGADGKIKNPALAADAVITVYLHDSPDATAKEKMEMLKRLAELIRAEEKYNLYDYNCAANVKEVMQAVKSMHYNESQRVRISAEGGPITLIKIVESASSDHMQTSFDKALDGEDSAMLGKGNDLHKLRETIRDAKILKTRPGGLELAT